MAKILDKFFGGGRRQSQKRKNIRNLILSEYEGGFKDETPNCTLK